MFCCELFRVEFSKFRAEKQVECLKNNRPFEPEDTEKGWTVPELLGLAGLIHLELRRIYQTQQKKAQIESEPCMITEAVLSAINKVGLLNDQIDSGKYDGKYDESEVFNVETILPDGKYPERRAIRINKNVQTDISEDYINN
jgi:hypothetical protein